MKKEFLIKHKISKQAMLNLKRYNNCIVWPYMNIRYFITLHTGIPLETKQKNWLTNKI